MEIPEKQKESKKVTVVVALEDQSICIIPHNALANDELFLLNNNDGVTHLKEFTYLEHIEGQSIADTLNWVKETCDIEIHEEITTDFVYSATVDRIREALKNV